ncbi:lipopolysaccharide transport periplasmic protein LptA [Helicobacter sp. faydin-H20]|uniref:lipopolysaccharide transport periplasmic protein LptA n=1 Tax=Helicobacter anatolicus TaxID=2905874 RepID=UPI001E4FDEA6|nr:lipopolysaccharide transport periplasmic protein LptA [Helicobacter anatolicus]MCE3036610.1 lipopolysaccharide transport periplasmic protein LptA [Helicobacter anatolicus]
MRILFLLLFLNVAFGEFLEVVAEKFTGDNLKGISVIEGNVDIKKGEDRLRADKVTIYTKENKLQEVYAEGNVDFMITTPDSRKIKGKSKSLRYDALQTQYHLLGDVHAQEEGKENSLNGDEVIVNKETGYMNVVGNKNKPARLIFNIDEVKKDGQGSTK